MPLKLEHEWFREATLPQVRDYLRDACGIPVTRKNIFRLRQYGTVIVFLPDNELDAEAARMNTVEGMLATVCKNNIGFIGFAAAAQAGASVAA